MHPSANITIKPHQDRLVKEVEQRSHVHIGRCYHCQSCTNGCPFYAAMDIFPNQIIRMVQLGLEREVLLSKTIWTCVGCNTCSSVCPMAIDMAAIMDALRQMAIEQKILPSEPDVLAFHQAVLGSVERYGRSHKLEIMMRFKLKKRDFFSDFNVGLKMLRKKKLDLTPSKVEDMKAVRKIFRDSRREWPHG